MFVMGARNTMGSMIHQPSVLRQPNNILLEKCEKCVIKQVDDDDFKKSLIRIKIFIRY